MVVVVVRVFAVVVVVVAVVVTAVEVSVPAVCVATVVVVWVAGLSVQLLVPLGCAVCEVLEGVAIGERGLVVPDDSWEGVVVDAVGLLVVVVEVNRVVGGLAGLVVVVDVVPAVGGLSGLVVVVAVGVPVHVPPAFVVLWAVGVVLEVDRVVVEVLQDVVVVGVVPSGVVSMVVGDRVDLVAVGVSGDVVAVVVGSQVVVIVVDRVVGGVLGDVGVLGVVSAGGAVVPVRVGGATVGVFPVVPVSLVEDDGGNRVVVGVPEGVVVVVVVLVPLVEDDGVDRVVVAVPEGVVVVVVVLLVLVDVVDRVVGEVLEAVVVVVVVPLVVVVVVDRVVDGPVGVVEVVVVGFGLSHRSCWLAVGALEGFGSPVEASIVVVGGGPHQVVVSAVDRVVGGVDGVLVVVHVAGSPSLVPRDVGHGSPGGSVVSPFPSMVPRISVVARRCQQRIAMGCGLAGREGVGLLVCFQLKAAHMEVCLKGWLSDHKKWLTLGSWGSGIVLRGKPVVGLGQGRCVKPGVVGGRAGLRTVSTALWIIRVRLCPSTLLARWQLAASFGGVCGSERG